MLVSELMLVVLVPVPMLVMLVPVPMLGGAGANADGAIAYGTEHGITINVA